MNKTDYFSNLPALAAGIVTLGGYWVAKEHFAAANKADNLLSKVFHIVVGVAEITPILGGLFGLIDIIRMVAQKSIMKAISLISSSPEDPLLGKKIDHITSEVKKPEARSHRVAVRFDETEEISHSYIASAQSKYLTPEAPAEFPQPHVRLIDGSLPQSEASKAPHSHQLTDVATTSSPLPAEPKATERTLPPTRSFHFPPLRPRPPAEARALMHKGLMAGVIEKRSRTYEPTPGGTFLTEEDIAVRERCPDHRPIRFSIAPHFQGTDPSGYSRACAVKAPQGVLGIVIEGNIPISIAGKIPKFLEQDFAKRLQQRNGNAYEALHLTLRDLNRMILSTKSVKDKEGIEITLSYLNSIEGMVYTGTLGRCESTLFQLRDQRALPLSITRDSSDPSEKARFDAAREGLASIVAPAQRDASAATFPEIDPEDHSEAAESSRLIAKLIHMPRRKVPAAEPVAEVSRGVGFRGKRAGLSKKLEPIFRIDDRPLVTATRVLPGDVVFLASSGVHEALHINEIRQILRSIPFKVGMNPQTHINYFNQLLADRLRSKPELRKKGFAFMPILAVAVPQPAAMRSTAAKAARGVRSLPSIPESGSAPA